MAHSSHWSEENRSPDTVLFDFGGTLDANGVPWKDRVFRLYRDEGIAVSPVHFDQAFYRADDSLVGVIPRSLSFRDTVGELLQRVSASLNLNDAHLTSKLANRFVDETHRQVALNADLLKRLSRRYRLGIVSNFYGNLATVCRNLELDPYFMVLVDSAVLGCLKPDPQIFLRALSQLGTPPDRAVFVGDSLRRDMAGARNVGMPHIWLSPASHEGEMPCCPGDPVIGALEEIQQWLL